MPTLELKWWVDGVLKDVTSAVLSSDDGTYGLKRDDTDGVLAANNTAMTHTSTGVYQYSFTAPAAGLTYTWWPYVLYNGAHYRFERQLVDDGITLPVCTLFTYAEFIRRWGAKNVAKASNKDNNNTSPDYDSVQDAFYNCEQAVSDALDGIYVTPLNFAQNSDVVPPTVKDWGMILAWEFLYEARGWEEGRNIRQRTPTSRITKLVERVASEMMLVRLGLRAIPALRASPDEDNTVYSDFGGEAVM